MSKKIGWRPTTREYDPNDPRPIDLLHPPNNTPPEVIEALWGGDLGEDPREGEIDVEDQRIQAEVLEKIVADIKAGDTSHLEILLDSVPTCHLSNYLTDEVKVKDKKAER